MTNETLYHAGTLRYTKAGLGRLFFWLLWGDFCYFMVESVAPSLVPLKFKDLGASNLLMGVVLGTIPGLMKFFFNPLISFKSDRFRSKWGRRIPFIAATMPFLVLCFVGLAFVDKISRWLLQTFPVLHDSCSLLGMTLIVLSVLLIIFDFFNSFVTSVFWYLFNDVVPEKFIARFMSLFRMVIMGTGILYNGLVYEHAQTHYTTIFLGAAALYLVGFGAMCVFVKEGEYPPPLENTDGKSGFISDLKTFGKECMSLPHYWYLFLVNMIGALGGACGMFSVFFQTKSMGLSLHLIGLLGVIGAVCCLVYVPISGWLADRYHPIRVVLWGQTLAIVTLPINFIWLFWKPEPIVYFYFSAFQTILLGAPIGMLCQMMDPPLLMRIFPRERYGQFCSCKAMLGSLVGIFSGAMAGEYLDLLTKYFDERTAYCLIPAWQFVFQAVALFFMFKLFSSWKRYGGDASYVPPIPAHARAELEATRMVP